MESQNLTIAKDAAINVSQSEKPKSRPAKKNKTRKSKCAARQLPESSEQQGGIRLKSRKITVNEQINRLSLSLTTGKRVSEDKINQPEMVQIQGKTSIILDLIESLSVKLNSYLENVKFVCNGTGYGIEHLGVTEQTTTSLSAHSTVSPSNRIFRNQARETISFKALEDDYMRLKRFTVQLSELAKEQYNITVHNKASHKALATAEHVRRVGNRKMQMGGKIAEKAKVEMALLGFEETEIKEAEQGTLKDSMEETAWQLCSTSEKLLPYLLAKFTASQSLTHEIICEYAKHNREKISQSYVDYIELHIELLACLYDAWITRQKGNLPITRDYGIRIDECGRMLAFFAFSVVKNMCTNDQVNSIKLRLMKL